MVLEGAGGNGETLTYGFMVSYC